MLSATRKHLWAAWTLFGDEIGSTAAEALIGLGMLVEPGGARELELLRSKVAELEGQLAALTAQGEVLREKSADESADKLTRLLAPTQALREDDEFGLHHRYLLGRDLPPLDGVS